VWEDSNKPSSISTTPHIDSQGLRSFNHSTPEPNLPLTAFLEVLVPPTSIKPAFLEELTEA